MMLEQFVWTEKYRPKSVQECILPKKLKDTFQGFVNQKNIPNLLLGGRAGAGKTTVAKAMLEELDCNYLTINASLEGNIDTLRTKIANFASSVSFKGTRKYIILDESDYITHATQPALRNFMETFSKNCGFILTANYLNKIIEPLHSRCSVIDFTIPKEEAPKLAQLFFNRIIEILDKESIKEYDKNSIIALIQKYFPDWRRILNELQRYSVNGKIDSGILTDSTKSFKDLIQYLKDKDFTKVRFWAAQNIGSIDDTTFYKDLYETANNYFKPSYIPQLVITLADYDYKSSFVVSKEINFVACMTNIMLEAEWR